MRNFAIRLSLLLACLLTAPSLFAQNADVSGVVTDQSGAAVHGAKVRLVNISTQVERNVTTNEQGIFSAPYMSPGPYQVFVEAPGFETGMIRELTINAGAKINLPIRLQIGQPRETVTVDASGAQINTTDASVSTVIDRQFVENLPLNGRSFQSLLYITPGVNLNVGGGNSANNEGTIGQFVVDGQRADSNYWMVDGVSANIGVATGQPGSGLSGGIGGSNALGGTSAIVSVDALQEFRIETSTYSPEFGRGMGGQISILTRSGTNQWHGTAFDYLRNGDLDATDWFADHYGLPKPLEIQNDFGGALGGAIHKDKTFFFLSAESLHLIQPSVELATVPDLAVRAAAPASFQPFLNAYPLPSPDAVDTSPGSGIVPYSVSFSNPAIANAYSLRIDHQLSEKLSIFGRYGHAPSNIGQRGELGTTANTTFNNTVVAKTATAGATWIQSANVVNDARFNYSIGGGKLVTNADNFGGATAISVNPFPAPLTYQDAALFVLPAFGSNMTLDKGSVGANYQHQSNYVDTLSVQRAAHSLKFGIDYLRLAPTWGQPPEFIPLFLGIGSVESGIPDLDIVANLTHGVFLFRNLAVFGQDTWHVNSRLNLTYGLRWDIDFAPAAESGPNAPRLTGFSMTNLSNLALGSLAGPPYDTHYGNVAPRIGGAYRISKGSEWGLVLRGGFGVFHSRASTEVGNEAYGQDLYPFGTETFYTGLPFPPPAGEGTLPPIVPPNSENMNTLAGFDPNLNVPYSLEWDAALEQSLGRAQTFALTYIGASDKRLLESEYVTNPNPNYAAAVLTANTGTLSYNALQAQLQRRLTNGLQALLSYSWSHAIDTGSYGNYQNGSFADVNGNRGDSDYDLRQVFSAAVTYNTPVWKSNPLTRAITDGWSTDDVVEVRTGAPVDITDMNFVGLSHKTFSVLIRPDDVPGQPQYLTGSQYPGGKEINPASFTDPPVDSTTGLPLRQGDLGRNMRRALGLTQWDFAAHRDFAIYERLKLQFRAELFNILNHPNFAPFNSTFQTGNIYFGQATQMLNQYLGGSSGYGSQNPLYTPGSPRSGELALKLMF